MNILTHILQKNRADGGATRCMNICVQKSTTCKNQHTGTIRALIQQYVTCNNQHTGTIRALIQQYVYNLQKSTYWYNPRPYPANVDKHTGTIRALIQQYVYNLQKSTYWYNPRPYPAIRLQPAKINILVQSAPLSSNTSTTCNKIDASGVKRLIPCMPFCS